MKQISHDLKLSKEVPLLHKIFREAEGAQMQPRVGSEKRGLQTESEHCGFG